MAQAPKPLLAAGEIASDNLRKRCTALLNGRSEREVVAALRTNRQTFARILAGLPVRAGSLALVRQELDRMAASERSPAARPS
jgi:hypothetical protein